MPARRPAPLGRSPLENGFACTIHDGGSGRANESWTESSLRWKVASAATAGKLQLGVMVKTALDRRRCRSILLARCWGRQGGVPMNHLQRLGVYGTTGRLFYQCAKCGAPVIA